MRKLISVICLFSLLLIGCSSTKEKEQEKEKAVCDVDCKQSNMDEYEGLKDGNHVFLDTTYEQAIQKLEDDKFSGILYYGYPSCPWCEEAVIIMNDVANDLEQNIYYVNKKSEDSLNHPELEQKTIKILDEAYGLEKDDEEQPRLYVPEVVVIKKGKIIAHHMGTVEGHDAKERKMNDDEKLLLTSIYEKMFNKIKK